MHNAAFAGVVMLDTVILVCDFLARAVGRRRNRRLAFPTADYLSVKMKNRYFGYSFLGIEKSPVACYNQGKGDVV
jgi:hypothetical protein